MGTCDRGITAHNLNTRLRRTPPHSPPGRHPVKCRLMTRRRKVLLTLSAAALAALVALPAMSQSDDQDVLKVIPENYKLLFENQFVRVIEARVPPGTEETPHRHMRGVSICMTEYTVESRILPDGQWVRSDRKLGTVYWSE